MRPRATQSTSRAVPLAARVHDFATRVPMRARSSVRRRARYRTMPQFKCDMTLVFANACEHVAPLASAGRRTFVAMIVCA